MNNMSNNIEEKLKEFEAKYYGANEPKIKDILEDVRQALQEQEEIIREEEYQRRRGATSKAANVNYFSGYEKGRRCAMKNRIDNVIQSQDIAFDAGYARAKQEMKEKLMQIVVEDVPHKYQERLLKELNI